MNWKYNIQEIEGKQYFKIEGVDHGYSNPHGLVIIKETEHFILCRKKGGLGWFSVGQQVYYQPRYSIYKKNDSKTIENIFGIYEKEYTRETMKEAKTESLSKLDELEKLITYLKEGVN